MKNNNICKMYIIYYAIWQFIACVVGAQLIATVGQFIAQYMPYQRIMPIVLEYIPYQRGTPIVLHKHIQRHLMVPPYC